MGVEIFENISYLLRVVDSHKKPAVDLAKDPRQLKKVLLSKIVFIAWDLPIRRIKEEE